MAFGSIKGNEIKCNLISKGDWSMKNPYLQTFFISKGSLKISKQTSGMGLINFIPIPEYKKKKLNQTPPNTFQIMKIY